MANGPVFDEGFLDRAHEVQLWRTVVEGVGAVLVVTGPNAELLSQLATEARCTWVPRVVSAPAVEGLPPFEAQVSLEFVGGVSLLSVLAQARATRRPLPVQAVAAVVHEAALGFEAIRRAAQVLDLAAQPPVALAVRVGFRGNVVVFPVPALEPEERDIIGVYPLPAFLGSERGVDLGSRLSPEAARGLPLPDSELVFHLGALLAACLRGRAVGGPESASLFEQLTRLVGGLAPELPDDVPLPLRDLVTQTVCTADRRLPDVAAFCAALRQAFELADGRVALAAHVQALFPQEAAAQARFVLDGRHEQPTRPRVELASPRLRLSSALEADLRPVSHRDFARYLAETGAPRPEHFVDTPEIAEQPLIMVSHADALAYCRWRGGRLPTNAEWTTLSERPEVRELGRVWEWTADRGQEGGWVVRGGPWRNQSGPGRPDHASWETGAAPDVGFRCVYGE